MEIYVGHDDRVPRPAFLLNDYEDTEDDVNLAGVKMSIFKRVAKKGETKTAEDYFLAGKSLPWWAIGASLIAANISAEQFIGMSGSGFAIGLAIASYEWMTAITLVFVAFWFLPRFLKTGLYTIPEFLQYRFDGVARWAMARPAVITMLQKTPQRNCWRRFAGELTRSLARTARGRL